MFRPIQRVEDEFDVVLVRRLRVSRDRRLVTCASLLCERRHRVVGNDGDSFDDSKPKECLGRPDGPPFRKRLGNDPPLKRHFIAYAG